MQPGYLDDIDAGAPGRHSAELWRLDAVELARLIRLGVVSCRDTVDSALGRLEAVNPRINAVVRSMNAEARAAADAADAARGQGIALGPLHGVPVTIKINTDQRGHPTDNGVAAHQNLIAAEDNPVVVNFRRAGAIVIGRTNAPAYCLRWFTENDLHGPTLNPWAPERTAGGSSGGAAAATAAGIGAIAQGNDIAGSIRYPAYCCGVVGLRPTTGRIPSFNATAAAPPTISSQLMTVQGPMARRVRDVRLAFAALATDDLRVPRFTAATAPCPRRPLAAALVLNPGGRKAHPAVAAAVARAGRALADAGYIVDEIEPPIIAAADLWPALAMPDLIAQLEPLVATNGDDGLKRALGLWREIWPMRDPRESLAALAQRHSLLRQWQAFLADWPIVVTPVSLDLPFPVGHDVRDHVTTQAILMAQSPMLAVSLLDLPAVAVPTGLHNGVPLGVQVIGGRYCEELCLDAAETIEARFGLPSPIEPRSATESPGGLSGQRGGSATPEPAGVDASAT
jgi:amidase